MVQLILRTSPLIPPSLTNPPSPSDIVLLDLQGTIETTDPAGLDGAVARMEWNEKGNPVLKIGHHILEGRLVPLSKPYAVLRKRPTAPSTPIARSRVRSSATSGASSPLGRGTPSGVHDNAKRRRESDDGMEVDRPGGLVGAAASTSKTADILARDSPPDFVPPEYEVVTVVKQKYLFKNRPEMVTSFKQEGAGVAK